MIGEGTIAALKFHNAPLRRLGEVARLRVAGLYVKDEGLNPTRTFKARGMAVAVPMASSLGATTLAVPTAGNATPKNGGNAEGWQSEPEQRMPTSYALNSCAITWVPADSKSPPPGPPLRVAQVDRPAETIFISESLWPNADLFGEWLTNKDWCPGVFAHPAV